MTRDAGLLHELLARGVPWPLAIEAVASTNLDREETRALPVDVFHLYCGPDLIYTTRDVEHATEWVRADPANHEARHERITE